jgi:hypothetical protein
MKQIVLLALILTAVPAFAQQKPRTLTVEQCRTDSNKWWDSLTKDVSTLPVTTFVLRNQEMQTCARQEGLSGKEDPASMQLYVALELAYATATAERLEGFIRRHNEWSQFIEEDGR